MLALTHAIVLPSASQTASALRSKLSRLNGWPIRSPADASRPASRPKHARLRADVVRYAFIAVDLHHLLLAGLPAHPTPIFRFAYCRWRNAVNNRDAHLAATGERNIASE